MDTKIELFESADVTLLDFCLCGCIKNEVYKRNVNTRDEFLARMLKAAACIQEREDWLRRAARDIKVY